MVVAFVLIIAVLNFALGFAAAVALEERSPAASDPIDLNQPDDDEAALEETSAKTAEISSDEPSEKDESIPESWTAILESQSVFAESFAQASAEMARLHIVDYREALTEIEQCLFSAEDDPDNQHERVISQAVEDLATINKEYLKQQDAADQIVARQGAMGALEETCADLVDALRCQASQIESANERISTIEHTRELRREVLRLLDVTHQVRDRMYAALAAILRAEKRLDEVSPQRQVDPLTGLVNVCGLEMIFHDWWRADAARNRQVGLVLFDLDHFAAVNEALGVRAADQVLRFVGNMLGKLVRQDRGFDRVSRVSGQRFVLFLGDTAAGQAINAAERIRQTISASRLRPIPASRGKEVSESSVVESPQELALSVSGGVVEIKKNDTPPTLMKRLFNAMNQAKQHGRNQVWLDQGDGPTAIEPPQYLVKSSVFEISRGTMTQSGVS